MSENSNFDLIIIGSGPGGYVGAIRAAQLGLKVACVERDQLGGVCLNWGCIPTKALLAGAEFYSKIKNEAAQWGVTTEKVAHNWEKVIARSRNVAGNLNKGVGYLFKKNKIAHIQGHAFISKGGTVEIYDSADTGRKGKKQQTLTAKNILIATGAGANPLPSGEGKVYEFDGEKIISSKEAMTLNEQPKKLLIIGAGAIGMEFAYFYNAFGTQVDVIEMAERVLPVEDEEASKAVTKAFKKQGITLHTSSKTTALEKTSNGIKATVETPDGKKQIVEADKVLVAVGVSGRFDGLFDDSLGIKIEKKHIKVDKQNYATPVKGIYAIGDVIGPPWLAHVASEEAIVCVEKIAGHTPAEINYSAVPGCTYCTPQVASIGKTEQQCQDENIEYNVGKFPFAASGKAQALGNTDGFVKMITSKKYGEILGCHMVGENVTELIGGINLGQTIEATAQEYIATIFPHPTMSEAVHEAALGTDGRMIHF